MSKIETIAQARGRRVDPAESQAGDTRRDHEPVVGGRRETELGDIKEEDGLALQGRTTASESPSCAGCGRPLRGRQERFCSDRCRMRMRRTIEEERRRDLICRLREVTREIEVELLGEVGS